MYKLQHFSAEYKKNFSTAESDDYMNIIQNFIDKFFVKQWTIGVAYIDMNKFIINGIEGIDFFWIPIYKSDVFIADPFVYKSPDSNIHIFYEDYSYKSYGTISLKILNPNFETLQTKNILNIGSHLSYPNVFSINEKTYIMPESSKDNNLYCFEYNLSGNSLVNKKTIIANEPLLDSTILEHNGKYWLFATKRGPDSNNKLYIYHSNRWDGDYVPHKNNPIKDNLSGSRPAGNFIKIDNNIYRPAQNSKDYYGKYISLYKLVSLNENEYVEEHCFDIHPPQNSKFKFAIHTINISDNVIVVDGLRRVFNPFMQIGHLLYKSLKIKR